MKREEEREIMKEKRRRKKRGGNRKNPLESNQDLPVTSWTTVPLRYRNKGVVVHLSHIRV